jgi:hypothetical protein
MHRARQAICREWADNIELVLREQLEETGAPAGTYGILIADGGIDLYPAGATVLDAAALAKVLESASSGPDEHMVIDLNFTVRNPTGQSAIVDNVVFKSEVV